jgi:hypothetical protein
VKPKFKFFIPAIVWFITIFILLVMPSDDIPTSTFFDLIYFDKWVHAGLFGMQVILTGWPFFKSKQASPSLFIKICICAILYGIAMEYVQKYWTTDRDYDVWDMVADGVGAVTGCIFMIMRLKKLTLKQQAAI